MLALECKDQLRTLVGKGAAILPRVGQSTIKGIGVLDRKNNLAGHIAIKGESHQVCIAVSNASPGAICPTPIFAWPAEEAGGYRGGGGRLHRSAQGGHRNLASRGGLTATNTATYLKRIFPSKKP